MHSCVRVFRAVFEQNKSKVHGRSETFRAAVLSRILVMCLGISIPFGSRCTFPRKATPASLTTSQALRASCVQSTFSSASEMSSSILTKVRFFYPLRACFADAPCWWGGAQ
jgi:hypothetical protein